MLYLQRHFPRFFFFIFCLRHHIQRAFPGFTSFATSGIMDNFKRIVYGMRHGNLLLLNKKLIKIEWLIVLIIHEIKIKILVYKIG